MNMFESLESSAKDNNHVRGTALYVRTFVIPLIEKHTQYGNFIVAMAVPVINKHIELVESLKKAEVANAAKARWQNKDAKVANGDGVLK